MTHRRFTIAAASLAIGALTLAGCAGSPSAPASAYDPDAEVSLDFAFWGNDDRATRYNDLIAAFNEEHPNITVNAWERRWRSQSRCSR